MPARSWFTIFSYLILSNLAGLVAAEPDSAKSREHSLAGFRGPIDVALSADGRSSSL